MIFTNSRGSGKYRPALEKQGIACIDVPLVKVTAIKTDEIEKALRSDIKALVFTSINGIHFFFKQCLEQFKVKLTKKDVWVVGLESKKEIEKWLDKKAILPKKQSALGLALAIKKCYKHREKIILIQGERADDYLKIKLTEAGLEVDRLNVYQTETIKDISPCIKKKIINGALVYLGSPSAVDALVKIIKTPCLKKHQLLAIGTSTAKRMLLYKIKPCVILTSPDYKNTLIEIKKYFNHVIN